MAYGATKADLNSAFNDWANALNSGDLKAFYGFFDARSEILDEDYPWRMTKDEFNGVFTQELTRLRKVVAACVKKTMAILKDQNHQIWRNTWSWELIFGVLEALGIYFNEIKKVLKIFIFLMLKKYFLEK